MKIFKRFNLIKGILIPILMLAIFLMPISPSFEQKKALAQTGSYNNMLPETSISINSISDMSASFDFKIPGVAEDWNKIAFYSISTLCFDKANPNSVVLTITENGNLVDTKDISFLVHDKSKQIGNPLTGCWMAGPAMLEGPLSFNKNIKPSTNYTVAFYAKVWSTGPGAGGGVNLFPTNTKKDYYQFGPSVSFSTPELGGNSTIGAEINPDGLTGSEPFLMSCSLIEGIEGIIDCVAGFFYMVWEVSAMIASLAGRFLDFFVYYSTNSDSYKSGFIDAGWSGIRDIANIFFIIALLFVAIKTILGLNVSNNKKIIGYVIIFALLINFSLFTTKVVIDTSNVLAKIFYNNIASIDSNGKNISSSGGGEKSISVGLVKKFNPQEIISTEKEYTESRGRYIFITILLTAITLYTAYIFFSVALLFVSRVVSLWFSMIFSPICFVSYALPFDIPGFGHKEWWSDLLKNAFLAPIFIFLLYLIVMFAGFLNKIITYPDSADFMTKTMSKIIPFIVLTVLLMKSREIAVKYSGEMGAAIIKGGQMIGGLAVGAVTGGAALAGRATLGRAGAAIANSDWAKKREAEGKFGAATLRNIGTAMGKGSMDLRGMKIAGQTIGSATGMKVNMLGGPQKGGFEKARADKTAARTKRAQELKLGADSKEKIALRKQEVLLKQLENENNPDIDDAQAAVETTRQAFVDANASLNKANAALSNAKDDLEKIEAKKKADEAKERADLAEKEYEETKAKLAEIKSGGYDEHEKRYRTTNGAVTKENYNKITAKEEEDKQKLSNSINKFNTLIAGVDVEGSAEWTKEKEKEKAQEAEKAALEAVAENRKIDINIAVDNKTKMIIEAEKNEQIAIANAASAEMAVTMNPTDQNRANVVIMRGAVEKARTEKEKIILKADEDEKAAMIKADEKATKATEEATNTKKAKMIDIEKDAKKQISEITREVEKAKIEAANSETLANRARNSIAGGKDFGRSLKEVKFKDLKHAHHEVHKEDNSRMNAYADHIQSSSNKALNFFTSGGVHSNAGADEAADLIRMGIKTESHGGGKAHDDHAPASHDAHPKPKAPKATSHEGGHDGHAPAAHH